MIKVYIKDPSNNFVNKVRAGSLSIDRREEDISKASFELIYDKASIESTEIPKVGNEVVIYYDNDIIFGGYITSVETRFLTPQSLWIISVSCVDYNHILNRYYIETNLQFQGASVYDIVKDVLTIARLDRELISVYDPQEKKLRYDEKNNLVIEPIDLTGKAKNLKITSISFSYITVAEALKKIKELFPSLKFTIDYSRNLLIYDDKINISPVSNIYLDDPSKNTIDIYEISLTEEVGDYVNRQIIKGSTQTVKDKEEVIQRVTLDKLQNSGFYFNQAWLNDWSNKYSNFVSNFQTKLGMSPTEHINKFYSVILFEEITPPTIQNGVVIQKGTIGDIRAAFVLQLSEGIVEVETPIEDEIPLIVPNLPPGFEENPYITPDEIQETGIKKIRGIVIVYQTKVDGKVQYAWVAEKAYEAKIDADTGQYIYDPAALWFFIKNSNFLFRRLPVSKEVIWDNKTWTLDRIVISYSASITVLGTADAIGTDQLNLEEMRNRMKPFNPVSISNYTGGYWTKKESIPSIKEQSQAIAKAQEYLETYAHLPQTLVFRTNYPNFYPGDTLTLNSKMLYSSTNDKHTFRITSVSIKDIGGKELNVSVNCLGSEKELWHEFFRKLIGVQAKEDDIYVIIEQKKDNDKLLLVDSIDIREYRSLIGYARIGEAEVE